MAKIYLDANIVFDLIVRKPVIGKSLIDHQLFCSPLSIHILFYGTNLKVPTPKVNRVIKKFHLVNLTKKIIDKALTNPTPDLEDNIQLHSAVEADCDYFLTNDKKLLRLGYFGKTRILNSLAKPVL